MGLMRCSQAGRIEEGILQIDAGRGCAGYRSDEAEYCLELKEQEGDLT